MAKTSPIKREHSIKRKIPNTSLIQNTSENRVERILVENFVSLQKVMTNLSLKFDNLASQISKLLDLFEISAKTLAEKEFSLENKDNKKILEKIDNIVDQNKVIARGLALLHESNSEENLQAPPPPQNFGQRENIERYQKSISSEFIPPAQKFKSLPKN